MLTEDAPRQLGDQYSISHSVLHALYFEREREHVPPMERVFKVVQDWFLARDGKVGKLPLRVRTLRIRDVPVVYGANTGRHMRIDQLQIALRRQRFAGTKQEDHLLRFVRETLFPAPSDAVPVHVEPSTAPAVCFRRPTRDLPPELMTIPRTQTDADVNRLCMFAGVQRAEWPAVGEDEVATTSAANWTRKWRRMKLDQPMAIGKWLRWLGYGDSMNLPKNWLYLLAALMRQLDGWNEAASTVPGIHGYLRGAVPFIRRVFLATESVTLTHPVAAHLTDAIHRK